MTRNTWKNTEKPIQCAVKRTPSGLGIMQRLARWVSSRVHGDIMDTIWIGKVEW